MHQLFVVLLSCIAVFAFHSATAAEADFDSRQAAGSLVASVFGSGSSEHSRFMDEAAVREDRFFPTMGNTETVADNEISVRVSVTRKGVYGFDFPERMSRRDCTADDLEAFQPTPAEFTDIAKRYLSYMTWDVDIESLDSPPHFTLGMGGSCRSLVSWSQKMNENNVANESVNVQLFFDLPTREIFGFRVVVSRHSGGTPVKWSDAAEIVRSELGGFEGFKITRGVLLNLYDRNGNEHPVWAVMFEVDSRVSLLSNEPQPFGGSRFVDVRTGELFERQEDVIEDKQATQNQ